MNPRAIIHWPCTFVYHNPEFSLVHFVNVVYPINFVHINLLVILFGIASNYGTTMYIDLCENCCNHNTDTLDQPEF